MPTEMRARTAIRTIWLLLVSVATKVGGRAGWGGFALQIAFVVPFFRRGSGGHMTIAHLVRGLETLGHRCSVWLNDPGGRHADQSDDEVDELFRSFFGDVGERVRRGFDGWDGADMSETVAACETVWQLLGTLPERQRAAIVLRHFHDLPETEIAAGAGRLQERQS